MKHKFLTLLFALMACTTLFAVGRNDGSTKANAIDFDWDNGAMHPGGTLWYRLDLTPIYAGADTLRFSVTNPSSTDSVNVATNVIVAGQEEHIDQTLAPQASYVMLEMNADILVKMHLAEIYFTFTSNGEVRLSWQVEGIASAYTFYFYQNDWAGNYDKYAVMSWSDDYEAAVYSEFMTPVAGHEGWFSTSVPNGNSNLYVLAYMSDATNPAEGSVNSSWQLADGGTYTYYYNNVSWMEDFDCKLVDGRILSGNILYKVDDEALTAEVDYDQSSVAPKGELIIPATFTWKTTTYTVTSVASSAYWYGGEITSVSLPNTLTHIGDAAFIGTGITSITIPSSVTSIEDGAFALCGNLSSVTLEEGLTVLGTQMFQGDPSLTEITIPNSITDLPAGVLSYCENLVSVTLGTGVDTIGHNAFGGSEKLARLAIYTAAPPKVDLYFNPALDSACSLMVPSSAKAAYQVHDYWKNFVIKGIYIVTFKGIDGKTIKAVPVEEGQAAVAPEAPEVECQHFTGWDITFDHVTADMTVTAQYAKNTFTVIFKDWDDTVLKTQSDIECGSAATAPDAPHHTGYTFAGWDKEFNEVSADMVVSAQFTPGEKAELNVQFIHESNVISEKMTTFMIPAAPTIAGFKFIGWRPVAQIIEDVIQIEAVYEPDSETAAPAVYINPANPAQKLIRDGQVYILKDGQEYTINGLRMK